VTFTFLGPDPLEVQVARTLEQLSAGLAPNAIEVERVDVKEEPGRRGPKGVILPGGTENEQAARYLAGEIACMANTPGGGALIVGVSDQGQRVGTVLDPEWLRHRVWELTEHRITIGVRVVMLDDARLLVLTTHEAIEPVRVGGKIRWRVANHCVEVDPTTWHSGKAARSGIDWSAQPSGHTANDVSPLALELARRYLGEGLRVPDRDLLARLHVVDAEGRLTNAGSLLFVETPCVGIDYIHRNVSGGDSTQRIRSCRSLLEQVWEVEQAARAANRSVHVESGFVHLQIRALPERTIREAIVNGIVHRDWLSANPTVVEHIGDRMTITSPGGFIGGVAPSNIITHPAAARYRSLAEAVAGLQLSEREGIGVDRMVHDMIALGHLPPEITEIAGPYVRFGLLGGDPDETLMAFTRDLQPAELTGDIDVLLAVVQLRERGWLDALSLAPTLQRALGETRSVLSQLAASSFKETPVIVPVSGTPPDDPSFRFGGTATQHFKPTRGQRQTAEHRRRVIVEYAEGRGRVSSTEIVDLLGITVVQAGRILNELTSEHLLQPSRPNRTGRGLYYVPTSPQIEWEHDLAQRAADIRGGLVITEPLDDAVRDLGLDD
jgi:ATP-dependent DNA helicase RecG